jgi:hypothetical protein
MLYGASLWSMGALVTVELDLVWYISQFEEEQLKASYTGGE